MGNQQSQGGEEENYDPRRQQQPGDRENVMASLQNKLATMGLSP